MSKHITWLHLSDLHYNDPATGWDAKRVLDSLRADLRKMQRDHGLQPDFIFFTGDAAFGQVRDAPGSRIADQFDGAEIFFEGVRTSFESEVPRSDFFLVPGNHDVNRDEVTDDQTSWLDQLKDLDVIDSMLQSKHKQWKRYMERLEDYRTFLERSGYTHLLTDPDRLVYAITREVNGANIGITGFNSAWSCVRENEKGNLWMGGRWQIENLLPAISSADLKIALIHHPSNWLVPFEDPAVGSQIKDDFDFCLHGHEHVEWVQPSGSHTNIATGACYEGSQKQNGYNFVRVDLETGTGEVWLRSYHSRGRGWVPEAIPNKTDDHGLWPLNGLRRLPSPPPPTDPPRIPPAIPAASFAAGTGRGKSGTFSEYRSDLPPVVEAWVGREQELSSLGALENGVVAITGIGGQGKSTLAAKFLQSWRSQNPEAFWDWRDCREQGETFHTQLITLIENITGGKITGANLAEGDTKTLVRYLFDVASGKKCLLILDNVDHYVNTLEDEFVLGVAELVQEAIRVQHDILFVLTCRPQIVYGNPRFQEIRLSGLDLPQALELFRIREVKVDEAETRNLVAEIWNLTSGHLMWLNLIAVQWSRNRGNIPVILQELRKGHIDQQSRSVFKAIWNGLHTQQQTVLRSMAEVSYPETIDVIDSFVRPIIRNFNQFYKAFRGLRALGLIVERGSYAEGSKFDLHPLVRSFVRTEFPSKQDRLRFIEPILIIFERFMEGSTAPSNHASLEYLERWTTKAELELAIQDTVTALKTLGAIADQLLARGFHEEFLRVARLILDGADWSTDELQEVPEFHSVVNDLVASLVEHNREEDARKYLKRYEEAATRGTVSYLRLCTLASYTEWILGNFDSSVLWGQEVVDTKTASNIDTAVGRPHTMALALRDSGDIEAALDILSLGSTIDEIVNDNHRKSGKGAEFYGNIGRCLSLKGDFDDALRCYIKSASLLEDDFSAQSVLNKGYASLWIGNTLEHQKDYNNAYLFYRRAVNIWTVRAPLRVAEPSDKLNKIFSLVDQNLKVLPDAMVETRCTKWIREH